MLLYLCHYVSFSLSLLSPPSLFLQTCVTKFMIVNLNETPKSYLLSLPFISYSLANLRTKYTFSFTTLYIFLFYFTSTKLIKQHKVFLRESMYSVGNQYPSFASYYCTYTEGRTGPKVAFSLKLARICSIFASSMFQRRFHDLFQAIYTTNVQENTAFWGSKLLVFECDLCWASNLAPSEQLQIVCLFQPLIALFWRNF